MDRRAAWVGAILALLLCPGLAAAQDWSVSGNYNIAMHLEAKTTSGTKTNDLKSTDGFLIGVITPYRVGFLLGGYSGQIPDIGNGQSARIKLDSLLTTINLSPWPQRLTLELGAGYGTATFDPNSIASGGGAYKLDTINLWQYVLGVGVRVWSGLDVRLTFIQAKGQLAIRDRSQTPIYVVREDIALTTTTLGAAWHF